jgi:hypothetical protein
MIVIQPVLLLLSFVLLPQDDKTEPKKEGAVAQPELRRELLKLVQDDQEARMKLLDILKKPPKAPQLLSELPEIKKIRELDKQNTERVKAIVNQHGWPGKSLVGADGAHAAWLLVQHADQDRAFQKKCLQLMREAAKKDEMTKADVAYLEDRVLVGEGKKQRYGTQFKQDKGDWVPQPIEDPANVDKRRAEVGLPPLAEYKKMILEQYKPKEEKK